MRTFPWHLTLLVLASAGGPIRAQQPAEFRWKFEKGKPFYQETTTLTWEWTKSQNVPKLRQSQERRTVYLRWLPLRHDPGANTWTVTQTILGLRAERSSVDYEVQYDSTRPGLGGHHREELFDELVGAEFTLTLDPQFRVSRIDGREELIARIVRRKPHLRFALQLEGTEKALRALAGLDFVPLPGKAVRPGETWEQRLPQDLGSLSRFEMTYTFTRAGKDARDGNLERIGVVARVSKQPVIRPIPGSSLKADQVTAKEASGHVLFDARRGRLVESRFSALLELVRVYNLRGKESITRQGRTWQTATRISADDPLRSGQAPLLLLCKPPPFPPGDRPDKPLDALRAPGQSGSMLAIVPAGVPALIYLRGLERSRERLFGTVRKPAAADRREKTGTLERLVRAQAEGFLKRLLDGRELRGLAAEGPAFLVLAELPRPKRELPLVLLARVTDYAAFRDGLLKPAERAALKKHTDLGDVAPVAGRPAYFWQRSGFAAVTFSPRVAALLASRSEGLDEKLSKDVGRRLLESDLGVYVNLVAVNRESRASAKTPEEILKPLFEQVAASVARLDREAGERGKNMAGNLTEAVRDADTFLLTVNFEPEGVALHARTDLLENSVTSRSLATLEPTIALDVHRLPIGYTTYTSVDFAPAAMAPLQPFFLGMRLGGELAAIEMAGVVRASRGRRESLELWRCADAAAAVRAYRKALAGLDAGNTFRHRPLKDKPLLQANVQTYRGCRFSHGRMRWEGEEMDLWFGAVGESLVQVTAADWKAARVQLDRLGGDRAVGSTSHLAFSRTLERLPEKTSWLTVMHVPSAARLAGIGLGAGTDRRPAAPPEPDSYLGLAVALRPQYATLDIWIPGSALARLGRFLVQAAP